MTKEEFELSVGHVLFQLLRRSINQFVSKKYQELLQNNQLVFGESQEREKSFLSKLRPHPFGMLGANAFKGAEGVIMFGISFGSAKELEREDEYKKPGQGP